MFHAFTSVLCSVIIQNKPEFSFGFQYFKLRRIAAGTGEFIGTQGLCGLFHETAVLITIVHIALIQKTEHLMPLVKADSVEIGKASMGSFDVR